MSTTFPIGVFWNIDQPLLVFEDISSIDGALFCPRALPWALLALCIQLCLCTTRGFLHLTVSALLCRYIVFEGEEGQDAGGLLREWYMIISREMFNPMYALFRTSPGDRVTYTINPSSHCNPNHLSYFKFVGRIVAKAVYDNRLLECYFTRSFYKHILGKSVR